MRRAELLTLHRPESSGHVVQFYDDDAHVIENVSCLTGSALGVGESSVLIATPAHVKEIENRVAQRGLNLGRLSATGRYLTLDADETLGRFMVDGMPDEGLFNEIVGGVVRNASEMSANGFVMGFGEMVARLCAANKVEAAIELERLWNSLARAHHFSLYCAYPLKSLSDRLDLNAVTRICAEHSLTIPAENPF